MKIPNGYQKAVNKGTLKILNGYQKAVNNKIPKSEGNNWTFKILNGLGLSRYQMVMQN